MAAAGEACGALALPQHVTCPETHLRPPIQRVLASSWPVCSAGEGHGHAEGLAWAALSGPGDHSQV